MLKSTIGKLAAGSVIAAGALLSVAGVASAAPAAEGAAQHGTPASSASSTVNGLPSVDCGSIDAPWGHLRFEVIADATRAGRVGCTEAFNVTDAYLRNIDKSEGTAHVLNVYGWTVMTDTGAYGTGRIAGEKDGLAFHADPLV